jgi:hypothetical protein
VYVFGGMGGGRGRGFSWLAEAGRERVLMPEFRRLTFEIAAASLVGAAEDDADCTRIHVRPRPHP